MPKSLTRGKSFKAEGFMSIMRNALMRELKEHFPDVDRHITYGSVTKQKRIEFKLPKDHYIDARCISGNPQAKYAGFVYYMRKIRCHNRQIHKMKTQKGGLKKLNQCQKEIFGIRLFDKVIFEDKIFFIFGKRSSGNFDIRDIKGDNKRSKTYKKLKLVKHNTGLIMDMIKVTI